jgi:hypothetical protein
LRPAFWYTELYHIVIGVTLLTTSNGPIYIGLSGLAGSGKTTVAGHLAPPVRYLPNIDSLKNPNPVWSHYVLAAPLYEMVGLMRLTEGDNRRSRISYVLFDILTDLLEKRIPFEEMVAFVDDVAAWNVGTENDPKPRMMMQEVGDACRDVYLDCFVASVIRKAYYDHLTMIAEVDAEVPSDYDDEVVYPDHYCVISDVRYENELDRLQDAGKLFLIKLDVSKNTAMERLLDRDGVVMSTEEWEHPTEAGFPDDVFDLIVDTEELNAKEVAAKIRDFILKRDENKRMEVAANG